MQDLQRENEQLSRLLEEANLKVKSEQTKYNQIIEKLNMEHKSQKDALNAKILALQDQSENYHKLALQYRQEKFEQLANYEKLLKNAQSNEIQLQKRYIVSCEIIKHQSKILSQNYNNLFSYYEKFSFLNGR